MMTTDQLQTLMQMYQSGISKKYIQAYFKVSPKKLNLILKEYESKHIGSI